MTDATRITVADRDPERAALRGIATYAALARQQTDRDPRIAGDALRNIEQHALEVLDGCYAPQPALLAATLTAPWPAEQRWPRALTAAECADLLRDPPPELQRVAVVDVLSMVPALGPHGARRLLRRERAAHPSTWLGARDWARLADHVATEVVA